MLCPPFGEKEVSDDSTSVVPSSDLVVLVDKSLLHETDFLADDL